MSSVQQLVTDLSNLSTEAKRRNNDVKSACDRASSLLKAQYGTQSKKNIGDPDFLPSSEHRKEIVMPFITSLLAGNAKFATISIPVLHRLILYKIIPKDMIDVLLESLSEASNLAIDIQLRILQCLPNVMQSYNEKLRGGLLLSLLSICSNLTTNNKSTVVINTASATLQQLFSFIYDSIRDRKPDNENEKKDDDKSESFSVAIDNDQEITLDSFSFEGFKIFNDLCRLASNETPEYLPTNMYISSLQVLELIENIVANHKEIFQTHEELGFLLRQKVIPKLLRSLNESNSGTPTSSFPVTVRVMRIIQVLLSSDLLDVVELESEVILSYLNHILRTSGQSQGVNRQAVDSRTSTHDAALHYAGDYSEVLVLEVYRNLFQDFKFVKSIFEKFDNHSEAKDIIQEFLSIISSSLQKNKNITQTEILQPVDNNTSNITNISRHSNMKISVLDHLDKLEAPTNIPATYSAYLILNFVTIISDGVAKFVANLSSQDQNPKTLELDVESISTFIEAIYPDLSHIIELFIYTGMDNENFHGLIRAVQKFTHTTGLLGLGGLRDGLLEIISKSIIQNVEQNSKVSSSLQYQSQSQIAPKSEQKTQNTDKSSMSDDNLSGFLSIGESIAETLGIQEKTQVDTSSITTRPRKFNSRHVTCFRALVNLAVSLGSTLDESWDIIWITFQWCDYFIYGPDDPKMGNGGKIKSKEELNPKLSHNDFYNMENSRRKFYESIHDYQIDSFFNLIEALANLTNSDSNGKFICPFNRSYFMKQVVKISSIDPIKFYLQNNDKTWTLLNTYFIDNIINRSKHNNLRIQAVQMFNTVIQSTTTEGFAAKDVSINQITASKSLEALSQLLESMFELGKPQELLGINCEIEIHLSVLTTLHQLIDKYDKFYQNSWDIVFKILNTPFQSKLGSNNKKSLLDSSFDTLKLILDEFIFSLPFAQLKILIDTLYNFCKQEGDLNISFSAVSYFWLIGDSIKKQMKIDKSLEDSSAESPIHEERLISLINDSAENKYDLLDVYLLLTLSKISNDSRAQVRDGAIKTFFQIIDVHGNLFTSRYWKLVYELVLPNFLKLELNLQDSKFNKKEWIESLNLILSGLVSLYSTYLVSEEENTQAENIFYWKGLVEYFKSLLSMKWIDLNVLIFKSFKDCLIPMNDVNKEKEGICEILFQFWINVPIEYDFINPLYQESLTKLMICFPSLYELMHHKLSPDDVQKFLTNFTSCARYPVLQDNFLDNTRPSKLQSAIYENFVSLKKINNDEATSSLIIQSLSNIIIFPFATRARIEQKIGPTLQGKPLKTPTFIAISTLSLRLLNENLESFGNFKRLIEDKGILKLMKSLLEIVNVKFEGSNPDEPLWIEANDVLKKTIRKVMNCTSSETKGEGEAGISVELWKLILTAIKLSFNTENPKYENSNIEQYYSLKDIVFPRFTEANTSTALIEDFIEDLYKNSFLFSENELEKSLSSNSSSILDYSEKLYQFDFEEFFGTTEPINISKRKKTAAVCLRELIKFASSPEVNGESNVLKEKSLEYFVCRSSFCLRRFISDESLLYRAPLPQVQQDELLIVVEGILQVDQHLSLKSDQSNNIRKLCPLLVKSVPYSSRIPGLSTLIEKVLLNLNK
ncbi:protein Mon2p [[Candida] railenensis]|uniref:Protein Mon2p n=1 Tax=[Candida] railenensis TaxID=45579 RepID=A0A9P0QMM0_9ASCO|nr:protein Mon2p [[Candida] railenensis]